jgi:hypothetical protein
MAKRKDSLSLFEVFGRRQPAPPVAKPATALRPDVPGPAAVWPPALDGQTSAQPAQPQGDQPQRPTADPAGEAFGIGRDGRRIQLTMTQTGWMIAAGGALVLLVCAFLLGRYSTPRPPGVPAIGPAGGNAAGLGVKGGAPAINVGPEAGAPAKRVVGKYYLVIQGIPDKTTKHYQDAEAIVAFMKENGVPADIRESKESYLVWSLDPMDKNDDEKALAYVKRIEDLGKKYKTKGGYNFSQAASPDGKPWFIAAKPDK